MLNQSPLGYNCLITEVLHKLDNFEQITPKENPRDFRLGVIEDREAWNPNPEGPDNDVLPAQNRG